MKLKRYCVTVMDNWTPTRTFWTERGAAKWWAKFQPGVAHLHKWYNGTWYN